MLKIKDLVVSVESKKILNGLNMTLEQGKVHVIMGPNGSGKSTLSQVIMGSPIYEVESGTIRFENEDITKMETQERAKKGIFLSFQYPSEIPGVNIPNYLRMIYNKKNGEKLTPARFRPILEEKMKILDMDISFLERYLNEGFSGGEKKRMEMLQMLVLEPKLAVLDEIDSGLDIDALKLVSDAVNYLKAKTNLTVLIITHYTRILNHIDSDKVFILKDGRITKEGDASLAHELEKMGYAPFGDE